MAANAPGFARSALVPTPAATGMLHDLLRTHSQPPDHIPSTIAALSAELARHDTEAARLHAELALLHAHLARVNLDRAALQSHHTACTSLLSPIRTLPSELLVDIFALCSAAFTPTFTDGAALGLTPLQIAMARLAHSPLRALSRVCKRWHGVTMGTPALWTRLDLDSVLWRTPTSSRTATALLVGALARGGSSLLTVEVTLEAQSPPDAALSLLTAHSERWQTVSVTCEGAHMARLSAVKHRLPRLESLRLWGTPSALDIFGDAPSLREVDCGGEPDAVMAFTRLPVAQLRSVRCDEYLGFGELMGVGICPAMDLLPRLARTADFTLRIYLVEDLEDVVETKMLPPLASDVGAFAITVADGFSASNAGLSISKITGCLTLLGLEEFELDSEQYPMLVLPWPHARFLGLAERSGFAGHLRTLRIGHADVSEAQLVEVLGQLGALEVLAISDHAATEGRDAYGGGGGVDRHLVTTALLTLLTRNNCAKDELKSGSESGREKCVVPRLNTIELGSLMRFEDGALLAFLESRIPASFQPLLAEGARALLTPLAFDADMRTDTFNTDNPETPFHAELYALPSHSRPLSAKVQARIGELGRAGGLVFCEGEGAGEM